MSSALERLAQQIAAAQPTIVPIEFGPWLGSMRSVSSELVPKEFLASPSQTPGLDMIYLPRTGTFKRRGGQTQVFDTFGSAVGMLPAKWATSPLTASGKGARFRQGDEFLSDSVTDGNPTSCALLTTETIASGLDDGYFANFWWRDQVNNVNRTLCSEFSTTLYPATPGSTPYYRVVPLWYDSGDGGITRGCTEFLRRFLVSGSRRFQKVNKWWYFPSYKGTPSRWNGVASNNGSTALTMASDINSGGHGSGDVSGVTTAGTLPGWSGFAGAGGGTNLGQPVYPWVTSIDDDTSYIANSTASGAGNPQAFNLSGSALPGLGTWTVTYRHRWLSDPGGTQNIRFRLVLNNGLYYDSGNINVGGSGTSWTTATASIDTTSGGVSAGTANSFEVFGPNVANYWCVTYLALSNGSGTPMVLRLIPSGPIPPLHCGTISGTAVNTITARPNANVAGGSWLSSGGGAADYTKIDEATADDTDYINSNGSNTRYQVELETPSTAPQPGDTVTVRYRMANIVASGTNNITVEFYVNSTTLITSAQTIFSATAGFAAYSFSLTAGQLSTAIAADSTFANARIAFLTGSESAGVDLALVSQAYLEIVPQASQGGWKGHDRFFRAFYGRWEDDSIWALTKPRFSVSTSILPNGLDLVTVDSANPDLGYSKLTHANIPILPPGFKKVGICRSAKIDESTEDNLELNQFKFGLIAEVDNGTTTYDDYSADDDAIEFDIEDLFIRQDHDMPNPARYNAAGDLRAAHAYGLSQSPCAIILAPIGRTADYDLNLAETSATLYTSPGSYMQLAIDGSGNMTLVLKKADGTALVGTQKSISITSAMTLQTLVDTINTTNVATDTLQWRAQLCPDASADALALTALVPHSRTINSVVAAGTTDGTLTLSSGGLSKVPVGALITGTGVTAGAYVARIDSDTQLTYKGTITAGTQNRTFYTELGDTPTTGALGWQRVYGGSFPAFLYFTKTYLNGFPIDKNATWVTVATPGSVKAAPNCFSTKLKNKFVPPLEAGTVQGVAAVDHGFVVPFAQKIGAIRSRIPDVAMADEDYGLVMINESHGCCAWNSVALGNRFAVFLAFDGLYGADLKSIRKFSRAIWNPPLRGPTATDTTTGVGDFVYEVPQSIAATAADNDSSYAQVSVLGNVVRVLYRTSSSTTHANREVEYDFGDAKETNGLAALFRNDGSAWGWSLPLSRTVSGIWSARRSGTNVSGRHLYGWNDQNSGSTGDGRIDELEVEETDNGTAISTGTASIPWIIAPEGQMLSLQEVILEHNSPTGSTGSLVWHRSYSNDTYTMTPGTSSLDLLSELKLIDTRGRAITAAGYLEYKQASGTARELRKLKAFLIFSKRLR